CARIGAGDKYVGIDSW
nr:immunoglobulin heavy chain junction region [Macaca mulatta]MOX38686.1 immunoglobulin heavy chain junction region [Macaca mulatta]MOX38991.1 immunoglobulin heavy chain junction region [Macaca mulatta]MOX39741.1 immunoglobulin heavy chain junction region [Macaca mulatta]MOX40006.1 immunoglobulin heavy chain junction region [Macaca mulatta]